MAKPIFLSAEWRHLCLLKYEISPKILAPHIPFGTELDFFDGKTYVSLVAFMFFRTKVFGIIPVLFHDTFEEINLRFYVVREDGGKIRRGVVFVKEIVPKRILAWVARRFYKENYVSMSTQSLVNHKEKYEYQWGTNRLRINANGKTLAVPENSLQRWITEHYWGYTKISSDRTYEYEVRHPAWDLFEVEGYELNADIGQLYGKEFEPVLSVPPKSVFLADGSNVSVHFPTVVR